MTTHCKVMWLEGMFLQPQHFQQQERYFERLIAQQPFFMGPNQWGIREYQLDEQLLKLGKVALARASGVMPDGTLFDIPNEDHMPTAIDIPEGSHDVMVYLALPLRKTGEIEVGETTNPQKMQRFFIEDSEVNDYYSGNEYSSKLKIGKLGLRLKLSSEDCQGYSCLALARIREIRSDQQVVLDEQFMPTCIDIQAVPGLAKFMHELLGLLKHRGEVLANRLNLPQQAGNAELSDYLFMQLINSYEPRCAYYLQKKAWHPESLYLFLIQMLGDMALVTRENKRPPTLPNYLHQDLCATFLPLFESLRQDFSTVMQQAAISLAFEKRERGIWVAAIPDKELLVKAGFIMSVSAEMPLESIQQQFPSQVKIAPVEQIESLVSHAMPGIELLTVNHIPRQIPMRANCVYFALNQKSNYWRQLSRSGGMALHISGYFPKLRLELWAVKV